MRKQAKLGKRAAAQRLRSGVEAGLTPDATQQLNQLQKTGEERTP
jgi:hypothetical protein